MIGIIILIPTALFWFMEYEEGIEHLIPHLSEESANPWQTTLETIWYTCIVTGMVYTGLDHFIYILMEIQSSREILHKIFGFATKGLGSCYFNMIQKLGDDQSQISFILEMLFTLHKSSDVCFHFIFIIWYYELKYHYMLAVHMACAALHLGKPSYLGHYIENIGKIYNIVTFQLISWFTLHPEVVAWGDRLDCIAHSFSTIFWLNQISKVFPPAILLASWLVFFINIKHRNMQASNALMP